VLLLILAQVQIRADLPTEGDWVTKGIKV